MFSMWGNLQERGPPNKEDKSRFYYGTSSGQILSSDGSGYVLPDMGKYSPESTEYIPKSIAMAKVQEVLDEAKVVRETYEENLQKVENFYKKAVEQSKDHYDAIISELKTKALRHVEVQRLLKQQMEEKLTKQLQESEHELEELRDTMATRNLQNQEEVRNLKAKISDSEQEIVNMQRIHDDVCIRLTVESKLDEIAHAVVERLSKEESLHAQMELEKQMEVERNRLDKRLDEEKELFENQYSSLKTDFLIQKECNAVMQDILGQIERREHDIHIGMATANSLKLTAVEELMQEKEVEIAQMTGTIAQLRDDLESLTTQYNQLNESMQEVQKSRDDEIAQLLVNREEAIMHLKAQSDAVLEELRQAQVRSEVEIAVLEIKERVYENIIFSMEKENAAGKHESSAVVQKAIADGKSASEDMKRTMEEQFSTRINAVKTEAKKVLDRLKKDNQRLVVKSVLDGIIISVVEKNSSPRIVSSVVPVPSVGSAISTSTDPTIQAEISTLRQQLLDAQQQIEKMRDMKGTAPIAVAAHAGEPVKDVVVATLPSSSAPELSKEEEKSLHEMKQKLKQLNEMISQQQAEMDSLKQALTPLIEERDGVKNDIKVWTKEFKDANGREPEVADKAQIRDKYQKYKVTSTRAKEFETKVDSLNESLPLLITERDSIQEKYQVLKAKQRAFEDDHRKTVDLVRQRSIQSIGSALPESMKIVPKIDMIEQEVQVNVSELRLQSMQSTRKLQVSAPSSPRGGGNANSSESDTLRAELEETKQHYEEIVEQLEDNLFTVREQLSTLEKDHKELTAQKGIMQRELDELIQTKRTDVIKRMEDEMKRLSDAEASLTEQVTTLSTEKVKMELRVKELKERAEKAEQELRDRDARDIAAMSPQDEKAILNKELLKQRDTAIQKAKAATAGWDAAANADEKLDLEVQKAYQRGIKEERDRHTNDLVSINKALEAKEQRITDLLVSVAEMEKKMHSNDTEKEAMRIAMENMKLEVADAIAAIEMVGNARSQDGNGDGPATLGPTEAELDAAREQLDLAQEEMVGLQERCDRLETELELSRKKNRIFERFAAVNGLDNMSAGDSGGGGGKAGDSSDLSRYNVDGALAEVKKAILKGTNLWKSNRKDDCYEVYLDACVAAAQRVYTDELAKPLQDCIEHGKAVGAMNKQKGAIFFRKGLDKFLADVTAPNSALRRAEEDTVASLRDKESTDAADSATKKTGTVTRLIEELNSLDDSLLAQGYTKENNPTVARTSPRPEEGGNDLDREKSSSLYQRAKAAEAQVASLKKQMAAIIAATAANTAVVVSGESTSTKAAGGGNVSGNNAAAAGTAAPSSNIRAAAGANQASDNGKSAAEVRRLQRKIKDLEAEIAKLNASGGGGGGASSAELKALQQNEKVLQKKLKDADAALKRDTKSLEMRATKAENALQKIQGTHEGVVSERDALRVENNKLISATKEMAELRLKADTVITLEETLKARDEELTLLQEQFKKESQLRKKYKNELEDLKGAIRVYARCRPMAQYEIQRGCKQVVQIKDDTSMKIVTSRGEKEFEFDSVFGPTSTQEQVFEDTKRLVESCLDGFNVCVFAYGQTGSGKTHTMTGNPSNPGLTPKAVEELFRLIAEKKHCQCKVSTYFIELYNDNLVDLYWVLDNAKVRGPPQDPPKLDIKLDAKKMVSIRNSVIKDVFTPDEMMDLFNRGNAERHTGATKMNAESSRSHSIFAIMVESYDTTTKRTTMGKLSLVDLAGSERADKTGASAERLKEAQNINKSLSALGDVIAALSEGNAKFIPYRNNKLTQLMQDSLGGNAKTLMFVNFSPADYNADETTTSLMYAARVKKIVNNATKQAESEEVARLKAIIRRLQSGQQVALDDVDGAPPPAEDDQGPPPEDDGKVYDGY